MTKISIIGNGAIGKEIASLLADSHYDDNQWEIVLFGKDKLEYTKHAIQDLLDKCAVYNSASIIRAGYDSDIADSDCVVIVAGTPRKDGMTRDDLLVNNAQVGKEWGNKIKKYCNEPLVIVVTNPVEQMVKIVRTVANLPYNKVIGLSGELDSARFKWHIADNLGINTQCVNDATVIGAHNATMVPVFSNITIDSNNTIAPIDLSKIDIDVIIAQVRAHGAKVTEFSGHSAYIAPATAVCKMLRAYLKNDSTRISCTAYVNNSDYYNCKDIYINLPFMINNKGIISVVEINLNESERALFLESVSATNRVLQSDIVKDICK